MNRSSKSLICKILYFETIKGHEYDIIMAIDVKPDSYNRNCSPFTYSFIYSFILTELKAIVYMDKF